MRRPWWAPLALPPLCATAEAAVSAEESRISIDLVVLVVIALAPILFVVAGCVAWKVYWRREQRRREVRRIPEKRQRRQPAEQHRGGAQDSPGGGGGEAPGQPRGGGARWAHHGRGGEGAGAQSQRGSSEARPPPPPHAEDARQWVVPESRLEWIVPQYASQVDGDGSEVMFAVPAVRVVMPPRAPRDTSGKPAQDAAEAGRSQDVPGAVASSGPPRARGARSNSPSSSLSLSEVDQRACQRSSAFPPLTLLA